MKIFLSGGDTRKASFIEVRAILQDAGHTVISRWLNSEPRTPPDCFNRQDFEDVAQADCILAIPCFGHNLTNEPNPSFLAETYQKPLYIITDGNNPLPEMIGRHFFSIDAFLRAYPATNKTKQEWGFGEPIFHPDPYRGESYWQVVATAGNQRVCGTGSTKEEASENLRQNIAGFLHWLDEDDSPTSNNEQPKADYKKKLLPTPGPWRLVSTDDAISCILSSNGHIIAVVFEMAHGQGNLNANARLIAAAPKLLETARLVAASYGDKPSAISEALALLQETLAKIDG